MSQDIQDRVWKQASHLTHEARLKFAEWLVKLKKEERDGVTLVKEEKEEE
jgi:hypothetical protein